MAGTPEISGQESETSEVINLAAELDAPDDVQDTTPNTTETPTEVTPETTEVPATTVETSADGTQETTEVPAVEEPAKEPSPEQLQLIQLVRQMRKELSLANAKQQRQEAELLKLRQSLTKPTDDLDDDDDLLGSGKQQKVSDPEPLSELEQLQQDLSQIGQQRSEQLITLVETMAVNPKYEDVKEVCSRSNLNDLVDAMAAKLATDHGIDPVVAALKVETAIWRQPNPYAWMYETIKANHPKYAKATSTPATKEAVAPTAETKPRLPTPAEAPPSVLPLGPTDTSQGTGWTASKLDAMDELELIKVPSNIRQQYLTGQL